MKKRTPLFVFLFFYLTFCLITYRDYGLTWDERDVYKEGLDLFNYFTHEFCFFAPSIQVLDPEHNYPYAAFLTWFNPSFSWDIYHLLNLLFGALVYTAAYELLFWKYQRPWLALAGPLFLFLNLPFSGSVPGNPKDIPFAIFYFMSLMMIYFFEERWSSFKLKGVVMGIFFGLTISSRVVGGTLFPILILFDTAVYAGQNPMGTIKTKVFDRWFFQKIFDWGLALIVSLAVCRALWPYLRVDFFQHLFNVFWLGVNFPPRFDFLFMGKLVDSLAYPWYYLPLWMMVSLPLFIIGFAVAAFVRFKLTVKNKLYFLMGTAFLFNIAVYLLLKPAVYDGLRHFLFLLPIVSLLGAIGFMEWFGPKDFSVGKKILTGAAGLNGLMVIFHLFRLHPYEYIYFNELTGGVKGAYGRFETDYWAASLRESVEWLKSHETVDPKHVYKIYAEGNPYQSIVFFSPNMKPVSRAEADYCVLINRAGGKPKPQEESKVIHRVEREGVPLSFILKMK